MSCYRCGKDLPGTLTECEPPCDERPQDFDFEKAVSLGAGVVLNFGFTPDPEKISTPEQKKQFALALHRWMRAVAMNFRATGLSEFCKCQDEK